VPSLAYIVVRKVAKLKPELVGLAGPEIAARRRAGEDVNTYEDRLEIAYATDTLVTALDHAPDLYRARVLIVESTFLDERKTLEGARAGCHIHLDEIIERADKFENEHIVLMHFSQLYRPDEIKGILGARVPEALRKRIIAFAPSTMHWPG
jgi:ribonuclease Z